MRILTLFKLCSKEKYNNYDKDNYIINKWMHEKGVFNMDIELREEQLFDKGFIERFETSGMGATVRYYRHPDKKRFPYVYYYGEQNPNILLLRANMYKDYLSMDYDCLTIKSTYGSFHCSSVTDFKNRYTELADTIWTAKENKLIFLNAYQFWGILDWDDVELLDLRNTPIFLNSHSYEDRLFAPSQSIKINGKKISRTVHVIKYMKLAETNPEKLLQQASKALGRPVTDLNEVKRMLAYKKDNPTDELAGMLQIDHITRNEFISTYDALRLCTKSQNLRHKPDVSIKPNGWRGDYIFSFSETSKDMFDFSKHISELKEVKGFVVTPGKKCDGYWHDARAVLQSLGYSEDFSYKLSQIKAIGNKLEEEYDTYTKTINDSMTDKKALAELEELNSMKRNRINWNEELENKWVRVRQAVSDNLTVINNLIEEKRTEKEDKLKRLMGYEDNLKEEANKERKERFLKAIRGIIDEQIKLNPNYVYEKTKGGYIYFQDYSEFTATYISNSLDNETTKLEAIRAQGIYERIMYGEFAPNLFNTFEEFSDEYKDFEADLAFRYYILRELNEDQVKNEKLQMYRDNKELAYRYGLQDSLIQPEVLKSEIA